MTLKFRNLSDLRSLLTCPIIGDVALYEGTWTHHISQKHPEMAGLLEEIRSAALSPAYVAESKHGPTGSHAGNYVLVGDQVSGKSSSVHVFAEPDGTGHRISTAFIAKSYHGGVVWRAPHPEEDGQDA